jgi:hypothetical protein
VNKITYPGVALERTREWNRQMFNKNPWYENRNARKYIWNYLWVQNDLWFRKTGGGGGGLWGDGNLYVDNMQGRLCKKVLGLPPTTVQGAAEYAIGSESTRRKMFCTAEKWKILTYGTRTTVWMLLWLADRKSEIECSAASLGEELYKIGMGYIWQNGKKRLGYKSKCQNIVNIRT